MNTIGDRVRKARTELRLSQEEFALKIGLGQRMLSGIEVNKRKIKGIYLEKLERETNISADWIITGNGEMYIPSYASLNDRILKICEEYGIKSASELTINTGLDITITKDIFSLRKPPPLNIIQTIQQSFPDVSAIWIEKGKGNMIEKTYKDIPQPPILTVEENINVGYLNKEINENIKRLLTIIERQTDINDKNADANLKHAENLSVLINKLNANEDKKYYNNHGDGGSKKVG